MRNDGRVIGQYEIETPEGKKRKYVSGKTKKEVAPSPRVPRVES